MSKISFTGIKPMLDKFDENGKFASWGDWSIANGGYDLWWEIYYKGYTVLQCIAGELSGGFRPFPEFDNEVEKKLVEKVLKIYRGLRVGDYRGTQI